MSIITIVLIIIVAIIVLGPDKLPNAIIEIAKILRVFKKAVHDAKETLDREVNLAELKREADEYKAKLEQGIDISKDIKDAKLIDDIKQDMNDIQHLFENYQPKPVQLDSAITNNIESQTTITENMQSSHDSTTNITNNDYIETQINLSDSPNKIHEERNDTQSQHDTTSHSASTSNQYDNFQQSLFKQRLDL